jgi:hypothetical protein
LGYVERSGQLKLVGGGATAKVFSTRVTSVPLRDRC